jgi:hypothetical protein
VKDAMRQRRRAKGLRELRLVVPDARSQKIRSRVAVISLLLLVMRDTATPQPMLLTNYPF